MSASKRLLEALEGLAEYHELSLGDLLEGIVPPTFEGRCGFEGRSLEAIRLREVYGLDLTARDSHRLVEATAPGG